MSLLIAYALSIIGAFVLTVIFGMFAAIIFSLVLHFREYVSYSFHEEKMKERMHESLDVGFPIVIKASLLITIGYAVVQFRLLFL